MATPQIPSGRCPHCGAPVIDLFAEWTEEYQTAAGKRDILAGDVVFDCYFCEGPLQLVLPLAIVVPVKPASTHRVAKRTKARCEAWLRAQHPGASLSEVVEMAGWQFGQRWAFDGYNWQEGDVHSHRQDTAPAPRSAMMLTDKEARFLTALAREQNQTGCRGPAHDLLRAHAYPDAPLTGAGSLAFSYEAVPLTGLLLRDFTDLAQVDEYLRRGELIPDPEWPWADAAEYRSRLEEARRETSVPATAE